MTKSPVEQNPRKDVQIVAASDPLDDRTAPELDGRLRRLAGEGHRSFVVDLSALTSVSGSGVRVLLSFGRRLRRRRGTMILCGVEGEVREVLEITGLDRAFRICDSRETAIGLLSETESTTVLGRER